MSFQYVCMFAGGCVHTKFGMRGGCSKCHRCIVGLGVCCALHLRLHACSSVLCSRLSFRCAMGLVSMGMGCWLACIGCCTPIPWSCSSHVACTTCLLYACTLLLAGADC